MALYIDRTTRPTERAAFEIPIRLLRWIERHGYAEFDGALAFLSHAAKHAAPITHPEGNKRFNDLLLTITDGRIEDLSVYESDCSECNDLKVFIAYDPDGTERRWPCPKCRPFDKPRAKNDNRKYAQPRR